MFKKRRSSGTPSYDHPLNNRFLTIWMLHVVAHVNLSQTSYHDLVAISNCWRVTGSEEYQLSKTQVPGPSVMTYLSIDSVRYESATAFSVWISVRKSIFIENVFSEQQLQPNMYFGYTSDVTFVAPESVRSKNSKNGPVYLCCGSLYACSRNFSQKY